MEIHRVNNTFQMDENSLEAFYIGLNKITPNFIKYTKTLTHPQHIATHIPDSLIQSIISFFILITNGPYTDILHSLPGSPSYIPQVLMNKIPFHLCNTTNIAEWSQLLQQWLSDNHQHETPTLLILPIIHNNPTASNQPKLPPTLRITTQDETSAYYLQQIITPKASHVHHYCTKHLCSCQPNHSFNLHICREGPLPTNNDTFPKTFNDKSPWSILAYTTTTNKHNNTPNNKSTTTAHQSQPIPTPPFQHESTAYDISTNMDPADDTTIDFADSYDPLITTRPYNSPRHA